MTRPMTNDELIKHRSRIYRGYRAPLATSSFEVESRISSMLYDSSGNVTQMVEIVDFQDGSAATKTTVFALDPVGQITGTTVTYQYDTP